jgi:hypothetical protein
MSAVMELNKKIIEHRHEMIIACVKDCWCWSADTLIAEIRTGVYVPAKLHKQLISRNIELTNALENRINPLEARIAELESEAILHARAFDGAMNKYYELKAEREWQPIETVPDDRFTLLYKYDRVTEIGWAGTSASEIYTHWMPLPKPPEVKK